MACYKWVTAPFKCVWQVLSQSLHSLVHHGLFSAGNCTLLTIFLWDHILIDQTEVFECFGPLKCIICIYGCYSYLPDRHSTKRGDLSWNYELFIIPFQTRQLLLLLRIIFIYNINLVPTSLWWKNELVENLFNLHLHSYTLQWFHFDKPQLQTCWLEGMS